MAKDLSNQLWHGIPRKEIPWYPEISADKCIGCELCFLSCGREVFNLAEDKPHKATVESPFNCMVGCSTCSTVCPTEAITFPGRDIIWKLERQHKIFKIVHEEAAAKKEKIKQRDLKEAAEKQLAETTTKMRFEVAGVFGDKRFLKKLEEAVQNDPVDIVNLELKVPTVKGLSEKTPAYMKFELTSTEMEEVKIYVEKIRSLINENELILINESK
ncbi:4Fe-4S ferredoxin, iron-sulfur binding [hydrothermal vent metagenome]|uniref:4Fe-4S ferredoxin, iron-sulfur binding n=1 Tax=hydrothermal vent metagenome TaxID=652676 RepID=A0A3B1CYM0_9ZZZZ